MFALGKQSLENAKLVHPKLVEVAKLACNMSLQDFGVTKDGGARTAEEQLELFNRGVTQKDGFKKRSNHQTYPDGFGRAIDLVPYVNGKFVWDDTWNLHYPVAVAMGLASRKLNIPVKWGGAWYYLMSEYPATLGGVKAAVERYKAEHAGPDFVDAPHFELVEK